MIDTCQANTMYTKLYSPNIIATGSSELDQSSYSHHADNDVGVAVIDRYTYDNEKILSHAGVRYDLFRGGAEAARSRLVTDFFGNVQNVEVDGSKNTTMEEDLLALSKTIAALRKLAEEETSSAAAGGKNATTPDTKAASTKRMQFAKPLTKENKKTKKEAKATAQAGNTMLWGLGSYLERT